MIRTNCAACAAPLAHDAPRCVRCKTRYGNSTCQHDHWRRGHKQICKKIHRGGNAEQYNADKKCKEAVAIAVEACADDTKGQKCYICLEAVHPRTGEGLVRGCACGDRDGVSSPELGVAHVSCLAEQAKMLVEEAEENKLDAEVKQVRWRRWDTCGLCEQSYHGVVRCALGWACWKTYVGQPKADGFRRCSMTQLGNGLSLANHNEDALSVQEAELSMLRRLGVSEYNILIAQGNLANTYEALGRKDALRMRRDAYIGYSRLLGENDRVTLLVANNYALSLLKLEFYKEAKLLMHKCLPAARLLGESDETMLRNRLYYAMAIYEDNTTTLDDLREAVTTLEETERIARRVLGTAHPLVLGLGRRLENARFFHAREAGESVDSA